MRPTILMNRHDDMLLDRLMNMVIRAGQALRSAYKYA